MKTLAIIGGGISGIAAAYYATQSGWQVDLYEADDRLGGRIGCTTLNGRNIEFGGKNIGRNYDRFRQFTSAIGQDQYEEFGLNSSRSIGGRVANFNKDHSRLRTITQVFRLCGARGLAQLLPLVIALKRDPRQGFLHSRHFDQLAERRNDPTLADVFARQCAVNFIRTLTVRMNAAEPDECHLGNFGSNLGLVLDSYEQCVGGMASVIDAFSEHVASSVSILLNQTVSAISRIGKDVRVSSQGHQGTLMKRYDHVVVALPSPQAAGLLGNERPDLSDTLDHVRYYPVAVGIAQYRHDVFTPDRRAMVFGTESPLSNAGAYGINDLNIVRYTFSGRAAREIISEATTKESALDIAEQILAPHFQVRDQVRDGSTFRFLRTGLCAYSAHHGQLLETLRTLTPVSDGISLTGDYWRGASIEACFHAAEDTINRINTEQRGPGAR